ncbi:MAG: LysE family translocator [Kordiimonadaceae bacterium]|nr:LysE family translocator [Kordiimonadaceae bacterium]MBT6467275.1 LysE family translocator [Kordiimonadaceae bacterium]MBT7545176.1 LysE family translocator [Kordiimonadaceae bacterium]MBT7604813.1 LysE family translocator [Kordiimonadaceae bacterium]
MSLFIPMFIYSFSMGITPGPNNIIALSTGVNYGFKKALPFAFGVIVGFNLLIAALGFGIGGIIANNNQLMDLLAFVAVGFITFMGFKIASSPTEIKDGNNDNPGFIYGVFLQLINPKAWTSSLGAIAAFNLAGNNIGILLYMLISVFVVFFCIVFWAYAGSKITRFLSNKTKHRIFNLLMGGSLILLAAYLFFMKI